MGDLTLVPITLREANAFVRRHHRHHGPSRGCRFCVGAARGGVVVAVAIVSRPRARHLQDGWTAEVVRLASVDNLIQQLVAAFRALRGDPSSHHASGACSMLYAACWRAARALGYRRLVTYTLPAEGRISLEAVGWKLLGEAGGGSWDRAERPRVDTHPTQTKLRWEVAA